MGLDSQSIVSTDLSGISTCVQSIRVGDLRKVHRMLMRNGTHSSSVPARGTESENTHGHTLSLKLCVVSLLCHAPDVLHRECDVGVRLAMDGDGHLFLSHQLGGCPHIRPLSLVFGLCSWWCHQRGVACWWVFHGFEQLQPTCRCHLAAAMRPKPIEDTTDAHGRHTYTPHLTMVWVRELRIQEVRTYEYKPRPQQLSQVSPVLTGCSSDMLHGGNKAAT